MLGDTLKKLGGNVSTVAPVSVRSECEARPEVTLKMLGGTVSTVAPVSVRSEREARETEKEPLENLNLSRSLNHETWGFALPSKAFFSSWEGEREKLGVLGCTLLLPIPGVGRAVPGCRSSEGVFDLGFSDLGCWLACGSALWAGL